MTAPKYFFTLCLGLSNLRNWVGNVVRTAFPERFVFRCLSLSGAEIAGKAATALPSALIGAEGDGELEVMGKAMSCDR